MNNSKLIEIANKEIELNKLDGALWKKAFALTNRDKLKAQQKYVKLRILKLQKYSSIEIEKLYEKLIKKKEISKKSKKNTIEKREDTKPVPQNIKENKKVENVGKAGKYISIFIIIFIFFAIALSNNEKESYKSKNINQNSTNKHVENSVPSNKILQSKYSLKIDSTPKNSTIKILNIQPKYYDGISLDKGNYQIQVSVEGYKTKNFWINLAADTTKIVVLEKELYELKPPIGTNILRKEHLYYCLSEKIRLETMSEKIINYDQKYRDRYDNYISDYNSRCVNVKYYEDDKAECNKIIKTKINLLKKAGLKRFEIQENINLLFSLTIETNPKNVNIKILNIKPKYYDGIKLTKGNYHIKISKKGFKPIDKWINIRKNLNLKIKLIQEISLTKEEENILKGIPTGSKNEINLNMKEQCILSGNDWKFNDSINKWECLSQKKDDLHLKGQILYRKCTSCHGVKAEKKALNKSFVISDWNSVRIANALKGYKNGTYGSSMKALMKAQVAPYNDSDIEAVAEYIANLK